MQVQREGDITVGTLGRLEGSPNSHQQAPASETFLVRDWRLVEIRPATQIFGYLTKSTTSECDRVRKEERSRASSLGKLRPFHDCVKNASVFGKGYGSQEP